MAKKSKKLKKGYVRINREEFENSLESQASDSRLPSYVFETNGEVQDIEGDYALVKFGVVPTPGIWVRIDQLDMVDLK
jgi:hypothetical protein